MSEPEGETDGEGTLPDVEQEDAFDGIDEGVDEQIDFQEQEGEEEGESGEQDYSSEDYSSQDYSSQQEGERVNKTIPRKTIPRNKKEKRVNSGLFSEAVVVLLDRRTGRQWCSREAVKYSGRQSLGGGGLGGERWSVNGDGDGLGGGDE